MITVKHLTRRFGSIIAVDDVTFNVKKGQIFSLLGPNGAGKTTTIRMLATLLKPTGGTITINAADVVKKRAQARRAMGLIFQEPSVDVALTAAENLRIHGHLYGLAGKQLKKRIEEVLDVVELNKRRDDLVKNFSGGMRRRLEVARSILHNPALLLYDEPTVGLDPQSRHHIWSYLYTIRERLNTTILFTTHYLEEADRADQVAIIDHGQLIALDSPQNLKANLGNSFLRLQMRDHDKFLPALKQLLTDKTELSYDAGYIVIRGGDSKQIVSNLLQKYSPQIITLEMRSPSLDDVFLKLTGRRVREGESASKLKAWQI